MRHLQQAQQKAHNPNRFLTLIYREPATPNEWLKRWHETQTIEVPTEDEGIISLEIESIEMPDGLLKPRPDVLINIKNGNPFYVVFSQKNVFRPYDKPALIVPESKLNKAWWLLGSTH